MCIVLVLVVALVAVIWGFRRGMARQTPSLIGVAFGIICARLFAEPMQEVIYGAFPEAHGSVGEEFIYSTIARTLIFAGVFLIFATITGFLGRVLDDDENSTILNNIGGSIFSLFKYMLILSLCMNCAVAMQLTRPAREPDRLPDLIEYMKSDDGNAVEEAMLLGPACVGGEDGEELAHRLQLAAARRIS